MESSYGLGLFGDSRRAVSGYMFHEALAHSPGEDLRAIDGAARGGRKLAAAVAQRVLDAA